MLEVQLNQEQAPTKQTNWAGNIALTSRAVFRPSSLEALQNTIKDADSVSIWGRLHSFNSIAANDHAVISTNNLIGKVAALGNDLFEIPGFLTLDQAVRELNQFGYAFSSLGEILDQTVAGAISTATHGTGLNWGTLSDQIVAVKVITASGEILEFNSTLAKDQKWLRAARVSLGSLGFLWSATFKLERQFFLEEVTQTYDLSEIDFSFAERHDHVRLYVLPYTNRLIGKTRNRIAESQVSMRPEDLLRTKARRKRKENEQLGLKMRLLSKLSPQHTCAPFMRHAGKKQKPRILQGLGFQIQTSSVTMAHYEMELAVPYEKTFDALQRVREISHNHAKKSSFIPHLPVALRFVGGFDTAILSPTQGKRTTYIGLNAYPAKGFGDYLGFFREVERQLTREFGARPHWGKLFFLNPTSSYTSFGSFLQLREQLDPNEKFLNPFLKNILKPTT